MASGNSKNGRGPLEEDLGRVYRGGANELPPSALDDKILAAARDAVESPRTQRARLKRWTVPLSAAALVILSVGVVYDLVRTPVHDRMEVASAPAAPPAGAEQTAPLAKSLDEVVTPPARNDAADAQAFNDNAVATTAPTEMKRESAKAKPAQAPVASSAESAPAERRAKKSLAQAPASEPAAPAVAAAPAEAEARAAATGGKAASGIRAAEKPQVLMALTANMQFVSVRTVANAYEFTVTIHSADVDCSRYADWWEIVDGDGKLLQRQVLTQPHAKTQPFTSTGKPVSIAPDRIVWIRAHLRGQGYGTAALTGSIRDGFIPTFLPADFAAELERRPPQPGKCTL